MRQDHASMIFEYESTSDRLALLLKVYQRNISDETTSSSQLCVWPDFSVPAI